MKTTANSIVEYGSILAIIAKTNEVLNKIKNSDGYQQIVQKNETAEEDAIYDRILEMLLISRNINYRD